MKKQFVLGIGLAAVFLILLAGSGLADSNKMTLKVGDEVYACNCGDACPCQTMSNKAGQCSCGQDLVKAKVVKVEGDMASLKAEGWDGPREFNTVGKYACACGPGCDCNTISQTEGKCTCGVDLKKVE